jgi:hypothetical protein
MSAVNCANTVLEIRHKFEAVGNIRRDRIGGFWLSDVLFTKEEGLQDSMEGPRDCKR